MKDASQNIKDKIVAFPPFGKYTQILRDMAKELDINLLEQLPITNEMISKGCKHSAEMICFPYKFTIGYFMEALDKGANTLLMFDSAGQCRLRHYHMVQDHTLRNIGYKNFEMIPIRAKNIIGSFKKINNKLSTPRILRVLLKTFKKLKQIDNQKITNSYNIGIVGEIYCAIETSLNYDIEEKIKKAGMNPYNSVTLTDFLLGFLKRRIRIKSKYMKKAMAYFNGPLGGHGIENVASTLMMVDKKFNGIIWVRPLSCMPEIMVDTVLKDICNKNNIPLLTLDIDETSAEANVNTRIETFFELIQTR